MVKMSTTTLFDELIIAIQTYVMAYQDNSKLAWNIWQISREVSVVFYCGRLLRPNRNLVQNTTLHFLTWTLLHTFCMVITNLLIERLDFISFASRRKWHAPTDRNLCILAILFCLTATPDAVSHDRTSVMTSSKNRQLDVNQRYFRSTCTFVKSDQISSVYWWFIQRWIMHWYSCLLGSIYSSHKSGWNLAAQSSAPSAEGIRESGSVYQFLIVWQKLLM